LTELRVYLALVAYPTTIMFVFDWCGPGPRWVRKNRSYVLPASLNRIEERRGKPLLLAKYVLTLLVVWGLVGEDQWHRVPITAHASSVFICGSNAFWPAPIRALRAYHHISNRQKTRLFNDRLSGAGKRA
jgi:hypothetical protein